MNATLSRLFFGSLGFSSNRVFYDIDRDPVPLDAPCGGGNPRDPWHWEIGYVDEHGVEPTFAPHQGFLPRELQDRIPELPTPAEILEEYRVQFKAKGAWINNEPAEAG